MKRQIRFFMIVYVVILLLPQSGGIVTPNQAQQGSEIFLPERVELEALLTAGNGNDIYFQSNVDNAVLGHAFKSTESSYTLTSYDGVDKTVIGGTFNPLINEFEAPDFNALYHASNQSVLDLDLVYTAVYYDLTGGEGNQTGLTSMVLFEDEMSGFRFDATAGVPLILDLKLKGQRDEMLKMDIFLVSPSGEVYDYSAINDNFETFINQFIPVVPNENGLHTLYLSPSNDDIILESLQIFHSPPIVTINSGYTARWTGTETQTLFFKFNQNQTETASILDLTSKVFYNDSVAAPDVLLGRIDMDFFTPTTTPFGGEMPATVVQWKGNATFVAVTVTPPNEGDQFVKAAKDELGLSPGFDVEYAFWGEMFDVDDFTPDVDFIIEDSTNPAANAYYWNLAETTLIGLNSTGAALASIINLDDQDVTPYTLSSATHDILNDESDEPTLLPAGNYLILFLGAPSPTEARIHSIPLLSLSTGDQATFGLNLGQSLFFQLPTILPAKEYFNFTYMDELNATILVDYELYDGTFTSQTSSSFLFQEWYSNSTTRESFNTTLFGNTNEAQQYNIELGYLRVTMTDNEQFDPSGGSLSTTNATFQGTLRIERFNYLEFWADSDPLVQYESAIFGNSATTDLNGSKSDIVLVYDWTSGDSFSGYKLIFSSTNISYTIYTFVDWDNIWHDGVSPGGATVIDGINHYNYELEFGTNMQTNFGIVIVFDAPTLNGTFNLDLDTIIIKGTPGVVLGSINTSEYVAPYDEVLNDADKAVAEEESFLEENQTTIIIGVVAVAGAGAGALVILRRRKA